MYANVINNGVKRTHFYLFLCLFSVGQYCYAQFDQPFSRSYNKVPLIEVITELESNFQVKFFYNQEWLNENTVSTEISELSLKEALPKILNGKKLTYLLRSPNYIILLPDEGNSSQTLTVDNTANNRISIGNLDLSAEKAKISGYVINGGDNSPLNGTVITVNENDKRYLSDPNGYYEMTLPVGDYNFNFHHPTMVDYTISIALNSDGKLNVQMFEDVLVLEEVVISTEAIDQNVTKTISGQEIIDIETIKSIPAFFGEADVFNSVLSLPGVSKVGEGSSGINVRGGGVGQNLIQIDNAIVYNPSHLFGFFSTFNADAVSLVNFYRGSIPVEYGGRLSSVMDVEIKNGNKSEFTGAGGVGFVNSRFLIEGPIRKDSTSFLAGIRAAYPTYIIRRLDDQDLKNSSAFFGDANLKIDHLFDDKNRISINGYISKDQFDFSDEAEYEYGNQTVNAEWNGQISQNTFIESTASYSIYNYKFKDLIDPQLASSLDASVNQLTWDNKFQTEIENHKISYGTSLTSLVIEPGEYKKGSQESLLEPLTIPSESGLVAALFMGDEYRFNDQLSFYGGVRYSLFIGGKETLEEVYHGPEPRLSINVQTSSNSSVKLSYNRMRQYIHFISNTTSATPIDLWKLSNSSIKPSIADQFTIGYFRNLQQNMYETSAEVFYKKTTDLLEYRNGADLFVNQNLESEIVQGEGQAYGLELLLKKTRGNFNGWISYTFSRSLIRVEDSNPINTINNGDFFPTNFDQPHNISAFAKISLSRRLSINTNFTYNSGRPISYPEASYQLRGIQIADFVERNKDRIPDYHRLDISFVMATSLKREKKIEANWSLSIYNVYGRKNAYSVYFKTDEITGESQSFLLSVIARPIIALSYNFKF